MLGGVKIMSKTFIIKDDKKISSEVDLLLDTGFTPSGIINYLKQQYDLDISRATVYRYRKDFYKPDHYRKAVKDKIFKDCGQYINTVELKVALVHIFMERIDKALENEKKIPFLSRSVDDSLMKLNTILDELYSMYQDMGLYPRREDRLKIDATITQKEKKPNRFEMILEGFTNMEKSELAMKISSFIQEAIEDHKNRNNDQNKDTIFDV